MNIIHAYTQLSSSSSPASPPLSPSSSFTNKRKSNEKLPTEENLVPNKQRKVHSTGGIKNTNKYDEGQLKGSHPLQKVVTLSVVSLSIPCFKMKVILTT